MKPEHNRPYNLTPHGSRRRYRVTGCRCVACTRGAKHPNLPEQLTWPYRWLERAAGEQLLQWYDEEQIAKWKTEGLGDFEADEICIALGLMPFSVFPGYLEAGLDCGVYP